MPRGARSRPETPRRAERSERRRGPRVRARGRPAAGCPTPWGSRSDERLQELRPDLLELQRRRPLRSTRSSSSGGTVAVKMRLGLGSRNPSRRAAGRLPPTACSWPPKSVKRCARVSSISVQRDARDAPPGTARLVAVDSEEQDGTVIFPREARRGDAQDAPVPAGVGLDDHRARAACPLLSARLDALPRLGDDAPLERLPLGVSHRELPRDLRRARRIALLEEGEREEGRVEPSGGVQPRRDAEGDLFRRRRRSRATPPTPPGEPAAPARGRPTERPGPVAAMTRFSPASGTMSAIVPRAAARSSDSTESETPARRATASGELQRDAGTRRGPSRDSGSRAAAG